MLMIFLKDFWRAFTGAHSQIVECPSYAVIQYLKAIGWEGSK